MTAPDFSSVRKYTPNAHSFFHDLALFLSSLAANLVVAEAFRSGGQTRICSDPLYYMQFEPCSLSTELTRYPQDALRAFAQNSWPTEIVLHENLVHPRSPAFAISSAEAKTLHAVALQSAFLRYFESTRAKVEMKYGKDYFGWPSEWNFARIVRNAFAHAGVLTFQNLSSQPVSWRMLTYGPSLQGRQIIFQDMSFVEVLSLLEDLHAAL